MLHETINNDDFPGCTICWNTVETIRNNVVTMLKRSVGSYELSTVPSLKTGHWEFVALFLQIKPFSLTPYKANISLA